ncbi:MAG: MazG nucleotide pyrophosphohydrolase [Gemmatimonadetes bacterium]|nr:MazG nucleotide pyrophosphohydrolase [Gemmatimonadota bacterium]
MNELDDYQRSATRTINTTLTREHRLLDASAGLAEEAGEVLGHVRKHVMQGRALNHDVVVEELGDALWCLAIAADSLGVTLSDVARVNITKLKARHPDGFSGSQDR